MRALNRKLLRDLGQLGGPSAAIAAVIATGVAMLVMYFSTFQSLERTQASYYERYRFADVFASLERAPLDLARRLGEIPGVARTETRVVAEVTLDVPGLAEPAVGRLVSVPERRREMLDDLFLRRGRWIEPGKSDEVLVNEDFALAHGFQPGDRVGAVINGRRRELTIVGVALSPEFIYALRPGDLLPDSRRFGVFWMGRRALGAAFDMEGGFNDVLVKLSPGASEPEVIARLDRLLARYGGLGAVPRSLQISHWFVANELRELQTMGSVLPVIFLGVAAFLLNVVLTRMISVQRSQIAALKALGYSNLAVAVHYVQVGLLVALAGTGLGFAAGAWLGRGMNNLYSEYFRFPEPLYVLSPAVLLAAALVSITAAVLGAFGAVRRAARLPPAEAMRPEPPASFRETWIERLGFKQLLGEPGRMILRNLARRPARTGLSVVGVAFAVALLVLGFFFQDAIDRIMKLQFELVQRQDLTVSFVEPLSARSFLEVERLPGVLRAEPMRSVPARLRLGHRERQVGILGLPAGAELVRLVDLERGVVELARSGLTLSGTLAEILEARRGDVLTVEVLEGRRPVWRVPVTAVVDEVMGTSVYMEIGELRRRMREGGVVTGAALLVDPAAVDGLYQRLKTTPRVAGVSLTTAALESFRETLAKTMGLMISFNLLFASIIAFGVVYNNARISLSERERDLASLRVLGFTRAEISFILLGEIAVVTLLAMPVGLVLGYGLCVLTLLGMGNELFRIPLVVEPASYAVSALGVLVASVLSAAVVRRRLDRLDLIGVLKTRE